MAEQFIIPTRGDIIAGKYLIQEELGRGSYGVVFRAQQLGVGRDVALKTLLPQAFLQSEIVERFQREAALVSRLHHPHIITLYDFGESDGVLYMVMEMLQGYSLADVIKNEAPVPPGRAVHLMSQVLSALQAAHSQGIVHRDLKPENIILAQVEDEPEFVKVLDFGIAKLTASGEQADALKTLTVQGYVLGTPYYMAPEVITGEEVSHKADLYAVGLLLYELLCGEHPFEAPNPSAVLVKHLSEPVPPLPDPALEGGRLGYAIRSALAKDPAQRVEDATALLDILRGEVKVPSQGSLWQSGWLMAGALAFFLVALLVAGGLSYVLYQKLSQEPSPVVAEIPAPPVEPAGQEAAPREAALVAAPGEPGAEGVPEVEAPDMGAPDAGAGEELTFAPEDAGGEAVGQEKPRGEAPKAPRPKVERAERVEKRAAPPEKQAPPVKVEAEPAQVKVSFASEPAGAQVTVNGAPVCTAPCSRSYRDDKTLRVRFSKIGYNAEVRTLALGQGARSVQVKLRPGRIRLVP